MDKFYQECAVPKPVSKKKKKLTNGYKNKPNRVCALCGKRGAERHELFGGANRQTSIEEGFQIDLCRKHHEAFHKRDGDYAVLADALRAKAQEEYENKLVGAGVDPEQAREVWLYLIGKNYR